MEASNPLTLKPQITFHPESLFRPYSGSKSSTKTHDLAKPYFQTPRKRKSTETKRIINSKRMPNGEYRCRKLIPDNIQRMINWKELSHEESMTILALLRSMKNERLNTPEPKEEVSTLSGFLSLYRDQVRDIEELDFSNMNLSSLPEILGNLNNIQIVNLSQNKFNKLPSAIAKLLGHVQQIHLEGNPIKSMNSILMKVTEGDLVDEFYITFDQRATHDVTLDLLKKMKRLDMTFNSLYKGKYYSFGYDSPPSLGYYIQKVIKE